ncbi:MAG: glycosyltransferase family 39 protein [Bdellovibrionales bacterium]|jgi:uncharacterized protein (TIGR03663 family)|nr:glycosyltransferase family 39 protein [Bdellovibrionales bacterium]
MSDTLFQVMKRSNENRAQRDHKNQNERRRKLSISFLLLLGVTCVFRFFDLGIKPPHFDEGINGHFVMNIWRDGFYAYDPTNFHGPLYFYVVHLAEALFGRSVESFRVLNAVIASLLVVLIWRFRRFTGPAATWAAWLIAVSPAFTFYGRYAIHESLHVLGQVAFVYGRLAWKQESARAPMGWMAAGAVIMISTKETFFIFLGTWLIAELMLKGLELFEKRSRKRPDETSEEPLAEARPQSRHAMMVDVVAINGLAVFVTVALFTGFFEHMKGLGDFFRAFDFWSATGTGGSGHEKVFYYWLELMWRYEWSLLIGLLVAVVMIGGLFSGFGSGFGPRFRSRFWRIRQLTESCFTPQQQVLLLSGFGLWLAYSIIPYKTPWLILSFWPLLFFRVSLPPLQKVFVSAIASVLWAHGAYASYKLNFLDYADGREPYVYVQTTKDYSVVMGILQKKLEARPDLRNTTILSIVKDPWPLPYDLSLFPKAQFIRFEDATASPDLINSAGVILADGDIAILLEPLLRKRFARVRFHLRDAYSSGYALFDAEIFEGVLPGDAPIVGGTP